MIARTPASGLTRNARVPYPLGTDFIDTSGHLADIAWSMDPRLIQEHTTITSAEALNSAHDDERRPGQIVYITSERAYYAYVGSNVTIGELETGSFGWVPLSALIVETAKPEWRYLAATMPLHMWRKAGDWNASGKSDFWFFNQTQQVPPHPTRAGGTWRAMLWGQFRLSMNTGQYKIEGYVGSERVFTEVCAHDNEEGPARTHTTPVGISTTTYTKGQNVRFRLKAVMLQSTGTNTAKIDRPVTASCMLFPNP